MDLALDFPPVSETVLVTDTLHGVEVKDPYRWLEDPHSPSTRKWIEQQCAYAESYFDSISNMELVRPQVAALLEMESVSDVWEVDGNVFYLKRGAYEEQPAIMMRPKLCSGDITLVRPTDLSDGPPKHLQIAGISPDARFLAIGVKSSGADTQAVRFFDVWRRELLKDSLPEGFGPGLVFTANPPGFYYAHEPLDSGDPNRAVSWHEFGNESGDQKIFFGGRGANVHVGAAGTADAKVLVYLRSFSDCPVKMELFIHQIGRHKAPVKLLDISDFVFMPFFIGQQLYGLTDWSAPRFRVVRIDVDNPNPESWVEIVPECAASIQEVNVAAEYICVHYIEDLQSRIKIFDLNGICTLENACPPMGTARFMSRFTGTSLLYYTFSSVLQPSVVFALNPRTGEQTRWHEPAKYLNPSDFCIERTSYPSTDGTRIPITLIANKQLQSERLPTFITGYGGFGASRTPRFNAYSTFLLQQGFCLAVPNIRGGGEFGPAWHEAAKRHKRQKSFDDFIRAAEWLMETGRALPGKIAIGGGSNGGLLVAAAMTQRPDLFRAVLCLGPVLDMLRYHLFDSAAVFAPEFGTADDEDDFRFLHAYSPYHRIRQDVAYPAVLLISGDADTRCNPMHVRKMVAALQAASISGKPVLMQYTRNWGHMAVQPLTARIEALTQRLAFICHELGIEIFTGFKRGET